MTTIKNKYQGTPRTLGLVIAALLASPLAIAADEGWYLGAGIGQTDASLNFNSANTMALPPGVTISNSQYDNKDTGFKVFGGFQFSPFFALEGGHFNLGDYAFSANTNPVGTNVGNYDVDGWYLDMVGTIPISQRLDVLVRAGFNHASTETTMRGTGAVPTVRPELTGSDTNPKLGLGLQYALSDRLDLRLEAERYHLDEPVQHKGDVDLFSLGLVYRFGPEPVARRVETPPPAPAPVARATPPAVTPAPAPAPTPPPPPAPTRVVFSADSLFDFDQAVIKESGRQDLDRFIANLRGTSYDTISVTGHTDRIGSQQYNLDLSQRRADAVKNYLVETGQIPAARITARGVAGANSTIAPNACANTGSRAALILCLQPDRRVEVEVTATRQ